MRQGFDSGAIAAARYVAEARELRVLFHPSSARCGSGRLHVCSGVPPGVAEGLFAAESQGSCFNAHLRDRFDYREVTGEAL